jgi:hypothetical protein
MSVDAVTEKQVRLLRERIVKARLALTSVRTTQERQHLEGMTRYWEELLDEFSRVAAGEAGGSSAAA